MDIIKIHQYFKDALREHLTCNQDYVVNRVVDMYTHCTHPSVKRKILEQYTKPSCLYIVIATIAFGRLL